MVDWDRWHKRSKVEKIRKDYFLMDILARHLPRTGDCIELGCSPGRFLVAMKKNFGYRLTGIDISSLDETRKTLLEYGIDDVQLIEGDIFHYPVKKRYDIVCSFGLLEHFEDPATAFAQFDAFCKNGGYMVIGLPNFRYLFRVAQFLFGKRIYHNFKIMNLNEIQKITRGYETICIDYYPRVFNFNFFIKSRFTSPYIIYIGRKA
jgi:SAM-dependent methyltransferase